MKRIRYSEALFRACVAVLTIVTLWGCRLERHDPPKGLLQRHLVGETWSSFSEVFTPERGQRMAFLPFRVVARESGRMSETWRVVGDDVLELTDGMNRAYRYRWFEPAKVFAFCRETFPKPFFIAPDSMTAAQVFTSARTNGLDSCDASTVLRIAGGRVEWTHVSPLHVRLVDLSGLTLTRQERSAIRDIGALETLVLSNASVVDADLAYLSRLSSLKNLALDGTDVSDAGLKYISRLPLRRIDLSSTRVTDAGLVTLRDISTLQAAILRNTAVTSEGVESLRQILPEIDIQQ